jgi:hypothetical protein
MRQSIVEQLVRKYGSERGLYHAVMRLAEEQEHMQKTLKEMAFAFDKIATVVTMQNAVMDAAKDKIDEMGKHFDTDPRSTHAIVRSTEPTDD